jgi:hypothetical protein
MGRRSILSRETVILFDEPALVYKKEMKEFRLPKIAGTLDMSSAVSFAEVKIEKPSSDCPRPNPAAGASASTSAVTVEELRNRIRS